MENIVRKMEKINSINKKRMYLSKKIQLLNYNDKIKLLNALIDSATTKYEKLRNLKKQYEKYLKTNRVFKSISEIEKFKENIDLYKEIKDYIEVEHSIKIKNKNLLFKINDTEIKNIDVILNRNTYVLFDKLNYEFDTDKRILILIQLKQIYSKANIKIKKENFGSEYKTFERIYRYINNLIKIEYEIKDKIKASKKEIIVKKKYYYPVLKLNEKQILTIDLKINTNILETLKKLENETDINKRIKLLNLLKSKCIDIYSTLEKNTSKEIYKYVKEIEEYSNEAIKIEHKKRKNISKKNSNKINNNSKLSKKELEVIDKIKNNDCLDRYTLLEILTAYKYLVMNYVKEYSISILNVSKYISNKIIDEEIKDDKDIVMINSIKDTIRYRLLSLNKNDDNELERSILKELRIVFDFICKNYKEDTKSTEHDYRYDVIKYYLKDENGYPYVKKIINDMPEIVNVRVKEHSNEHIIINILKEYIYNYKEMLKDKNGCFINPDYLKQVYLLFMNNSNLKLNFEDKVTIDYILDDFILYLDKEIYKEDRKTLAKKEVRKLKSQYLYYEKELKFRKVDERQLKWQTELLPNNRTHCLKKDNRVNVLDDCITLNGINAYSLSQDGDKRKLKIHVIDTSKIVAPYTSVDSKIYNCMIEHEKISENIKRKLTLKYNEENPTITYEFNIEKGNCITDFKIYKSKIFIDEENNTLLKNLSQLSKKILASKNIKDFESYTIDESIEILLNEEFINYIDENKLPFIYCGKEYINDYINHMNNLSNIFNRLNVIDFKKLYTIISNNVGEYNYSTKAFEADGTYNLNLINDINYLFIFNQRLITDIIFNNQKLKDKSKYLKECEKLEHELNLSINHIKPEDIVFKNNAKRNKLKQFNL